MSCLLIRQFARTFTQQQRIAARSRRSVVTMTAHKLVHWDSKTCPYAQRSWIALVEKKLPFEIVQVDLSNKSKEFQELYASINPDPAAPAKVPILIDGDTKLIESSVICEYLAAKYADQGEQLVPSDPVAAAKVRLFIETFSSQVTGAMFGLLRADTQESLAAAKDKFAAALKVVNNCIEWHGAPAGTNGGGDYFLGGQYSMAEVCCTSFVQRALAALPHFRGVDVWGVVRENKLDRLEKWMEAALARPSAQETKPADDVMLAGWTKFVAQMKD